MKYVYFGSAATFSVPLVPFADANTVNWVVRDNSGSVITASAASSVNDAGATVVAVPTSVTTNTQAVGGTSPTENRFLIVMWQSGGADQSVMLPYGLITFAPVRTTPDDVILLLGTNLAELASSEIDIPTAAAYVQEDVTPAVFTPALTAGTNDTIRINRMIALRAAIELGPSLNMRLSQMQKSDTAAFQRFSGFKVGDFIAHLWVLYAALRDTLSANVNLTVEQPISLIQGGTNPDLFIVPQWPAFWLM